MNLEETMLHGKANLKEKMHDWVDVAIIRPQIGNGEQMRGCQRLGLGVRGGRGYEGTTPKCLVVLIQLNVLISVVVP